MRRQFDPLRFALFLFVLALAFSLWRDVTAPPVDATTLTIPNTFVNDTVIEAADFNDNFTAIANVVNGNIDDTNISNDGITGSTKIASGTVTTDELGTGSVDTDELVDGAVTTGKILDGTVAEADMDINSAPTDGYVVYWNNTAGKLDYQANTRCTSVEAIGRFTQALAETRYWSVASNNASGPESSPSQTVDDYIVPAAVRISNLHVNAADCGGTGESDDITVTIQDDGSDTALSCTPSGTPGVCTDTDVVSVAALSTLMIKAVTVQVGAVDDGCTDVDVSFCIVN